MTCKYSYNGKIYNSYQELLEELSTNEGLDAALAILFSKDLEHKGENIHQKLTDLIKEYKFSKSAGIINDGVDIETDNKIFTTQTIIDSAYFNVDGDVDMFRLNRKEYLDNLHKRYIEQEDLTDDEATRKCQQVDLHWDKIAKDASDLHRILVSTRTDDDIRTFMGAALNTSFYGIADQLQPTLQEIRRNIREKHANHIPMQNINLEAKLKGLAEKIVGHIDYLFISPNGDIEIFNLKVSSEPSSKWDTVKKEKFRYQLAFLKKILEYNGISSRDIKLSIVPVHIEYDENFDNVVKLTPERYQSYDSIGGQYIFKKYEQVASQYIDSNVPTLDINDSIFTKVNQQLRAIFPTGNIDIQSEGIKESAKGWIKKNWKVIATQAVDKPGWNIKFPGEKTIYVEDTKVGEDNETVVNMVKDREETLFDNNSRAITTYRIVGDIKKAFEDKHDFVAVDGEYGPVLERQLEKYFKENDGYEDGKVKSYRWELINNETLFNANILLFRNHTTGQLDVVTLTPFEVGTSINIKGRTNLLGAYIKDLNNENFTMENNYGNIEAIRTMTLLNEIIPSLGDVELGTMKIVSLSKMHQKSGREIIMEQLLPQFETIIKVVKSNNNDLDLENNFKKHTIKAIDPIKVLVQSWREAIQDYPRETKEIQLTFKDLIVGKTEIDGTIVDGIEGTQSIESKIEKLKQIIETVKDFDSIIANATIDELIKYADDNNSNIRRRAMAKIYINALKALNMYSGDLSMENEDFSKLSEIFSKPQSIPNTNVRTVTYMFQKTIDKISGKMLDRYSPIRKKFLKYLEDSGYTAINNSIIGNHAAQFKNLYEVDSEGKLTMRFKNPYDMSTDLQSYERDFLKDILWDLNKIRFEMKGMSIEKDYSGPNDQKLIDKVNSGNLNYLDVPLMKMSKSTRHENFKKTWKETAYRIGRAITHPQQAFREFAEEMMTEDEKRQRDDDIERLQAYNPFLKSETSVNMRQNYLANKGEDYFEYDLETIMVNFMEKHIQSVEFNKMLTRTKGILLDLKMRGIAEDDPKGIAHTVKTIEDFLQVGVYNKSIMEDTSQVIESFLMPIRRAVTTCYIAANPVAMIRDISEGLKHNMVRSLTKFQTDISPADVLHGYAQVIEEGPQNIMTITKLNQLNLKYRFSNLDIARISEGLKTSGSGILNAENWAYLTLRSPDYLNRMVLFSARMHHDGVEDAYYIDDNGQLQYDWKRDQRFQVYLDPDGATKNREEYNKQRSKYLSLLRQFNKEGYTNVNGKPLVEGDALPDAYTQQQITTFKNFSDNIYGSYNQSTRAKYENMAVGRQLGIFSTWMNGIVDVYAKKRQISQSETREVQETDANGKLLYFDKFGNITTDVTEVPVMTDIPIMVQGVLNTLWEICKEGHYDNFADAIKNAWNDGSVNRRNLIRLISDFTMMAIYGLAYNLVFNPAYEDFKKKADGREILINALIEITYKGFHNSWDGFFGPFSVLDYIGNNTNPATYKLPTKAINDLFRFIFGDQTLYGTLLGYSAATRAFRDSYRMYIRDTK